MLSFRSTIQCVEMILYDGQVILMSLNSVFTCEMRVITESCILDTWLLILNGSRAIPDLWYLGIFTVSHTVLCSGWSDFVFYLTTLHFPLCPACFQCLWEVIYPKLFLFQLKTGLLKYRIIEQIFESWEVSANSANYRLKIFNFSYCYPRICIFYVLYLWRKEKL